MYAAAMLKTGICIYGNVGFDVSPVVLNFSYVA